MNEKLNDVVTTATEDVVTQVAQAVEQLADEVTTRSRRRTRKLAEASKTASPKRRGGKLAACGKVVAAGAILAGVAAAVRQFIATQDSGWQAHEPSDPYVSPSASNIVEDIVEDIESDAAAD